MKIWTAIIEYVPRSQRDYFSIRDYVAVIPHLKIMDSKVIN